MKVVMATPGYIVEQLKQLGFKVDDRGRLAVPTRWHRDQGPLMKWGGWHRYVCPCGLRRVMHEVRLNNRQIYLDQCSRCGIFNWREL